MARGNGFPVNNSYSRWELRGVWIGCKVIVFQRHMTGAALVIGLGLFMVLQFPFPAIFTTGTSAYCYTHDLA